MADANVVEDGEIYLFDIHQEGAEVGPVGVSESGVVYLSGALHVRGRFAALMAAAKERVPYIEAPSGEVLFPTLWLMRECSHDPDRLRVLENLSDFASGLLV